MLTYLVDNNNNIIKTESQTIMQKSSLIDDMHILVPKIYNNDEDMTSYAAVMEYITPDKKYGTINLDQKNINYKDKDYIEYILPSKEMGTELTAVAGEIMFQITWSRLKAVDGEIGASVRKTTLGKIKITPIADWSGYIPDDALTALDQRILAIAAAGELYKQSVEELSKKVEEKLATDIELNTENRKLQLLNEGKSPIGEGVEMEKVSHMVYEDLVGEDLDDTPDGVTNLDEVLAKQGV